MVGADGFAYSQSPPFEGTTLSGSYMFGVGDHAGILDSEADAFFTIGVNDEGSSFVISPHWAVVLPWRSVAALTSGVAMSLPVGPNTVTAMLVPPVGLPSVTTFDVQIDPDKVTSVQQTIINQAPATNDSSAPPVVQSVRLEIVDDDGGLVPAVRLEGLRFTNPQGGSSSEIGNLQLNLHPGNVANDPVSGADYQSPLAARQSLLSHPATNGHCQRRNAGCTGRRQNRFARLLVRLNVQQQEQTVPAGGDAKVFYSPRRASPEA